MYVFCNYVCFYFFTIWIFFLQSLNHLLNFQYTPRGNGQETDRSRGPRPSKNHNQQYRQTFSKEQYLQSNCQFIVEAVGDYSVHLVDPDVPVNWDNIQVRAAIKKICCIFPLTYIPSYCTLIFCFPLPLPSISLPIFYYLLSVYSGGLSED